MLGCQVFFGDTDEVAVQGNKADVDRLLALLEEVYTEKVRIRSECARWKRQ